MKNKSIAVLFNWLCQKLKKLLLFKRKKQEIDLCTHNWIEKVGIFGRWGGGKYEAYCSKCYKFIDKREDIHSDSGLIVK